MLLPGERDGVLGYVGAYDCRDELAIGDEKNKHHGKLECHYKQASYLIASLGLRSLQEYKCIRLLQREAQGLSQPIALQFFARLARVLSLPANNRPTVGMQSGAGNERAVFRGKKDAAGGDFDRLSGPTHRADEAFHLLLGERTRHERSPDRACRTFCLSVDQHILCQIRPTWSDAILSAGISKQQN